MLHSEITTRLAHALNLERITRKRRGGSEHPHALDYGLRGRAVYLSPVTADTHCRAQLSGTRRHWAVDPLDAQTSLAMALAAPVIDGMTETAMADIQRAEEFVRAAVALVTQAPVLRAQGRCEEAILEYENSDRTQSQLVACDRRSRLVQVSHRFRR